MSIPCNHCSRPQELVGGSYPHGSAEMSFGLFSGGEESRVGPRRKTLHYLEEGLGLPA